MAVPKRKPSKARTAKRRANFKLDMPAMSVCPSCGELMQPHRVCANCGQYNGRTILAEKAE